MRQLSQDQLHRQEGITHIQQSKNLARGELLQWRFRIPYIAAYRFELPSYTQTPCGVDMNWERKMVAV